MTPLWETNGATSFLRTSRNTSIPRQEHAPGTSEGDWDDHEASTERHTLSLPCTVRMWRRSVCLVESTLRQMGQVVRCRCSSMWLLRPCRQRNTLAQMGHTRPPLQSGRAADAGSVNAGAHRTDWPSRRPLQTDDTHHPGRPHLVSQEKTKSNLLHNSEWSSIMLWVVVKMH